MISLICKVCINLQRNGDCQGLPAPWDCEKCPRKEEFDNKRSFDV